MTVYSIVFNAKIKFILKELSDVIHVKVKSFICCFDLQNSEFSFHLSLQFKSIC